MSARRLFARAAIYAYPAEFRAQFAEQIIADVDEAPTLGSSIFDMIVGGIAMRIDTLSSDVRYALRRLIRAPLFVAIVLLTFALGIGANIAVFSVLDAVILRPLPFPHADSLVVFMLRGPRGEELSAASFTDVEDMRAQSRELSALAAAQTDERTLLIDGKPYAARGLAVTREYLGLFDIRTQLGRPLTAEDARPGVRRVLISDQLWRKHFAADAGALGRFISLDGERYEIVGVMRPGQVLVNPNVAALEHSDFIRVLPPVSGGAERAARIAGGIARLAPGSTIARANSELAIISSRLATMYPKEDKGVAFYVRSLRDVIFGDTSRIWMLFGAVVAVLLIACANVGNMLAARWSVRDRELAIRRSLGASSSRIAAQLFVETGILAIAGGCIGIFLAYAALTAMRDLIVHAVPLGETISLDGTSLLLAVLLVLLSTVIAGLAPLAAMRSRDLHSILKSAGRGGDGSRGHRLRSAFVVAQIALALALVIVSGLMLRSYINVIDTPLGIRTTGVVVTDALSLPDRYSTISAARTAYRSLLERLQSLPGVDSAALAWFYPQGDAELESGAPMFGRHYEYRPPNAVTNSVSPGYFKTFGVPVEAGRAFTDKDVYGAQPVAIVNDTFVRHYLRGLNPLGMRVGVQTGPSSRVWATIVGVVGTERLDVTVPASESMLPEVYTPLEQRPQGILSIAVHARNADSGTIGREIQAAVSSTMPLLPPPDTFTIDDRIANDTVLSRFVAVLLGALAAIALLLAVSGVFAVTSFSVTQRVREFGVRIALGATGTQILSDVLCRSLAITASGCVLGIIVAAITTHIVASQIDVSPFDPLTFISVVALIVIATSLASLQPALRATRVEPMESLRYE